MKNISVFCGSNSGNDPVFKEMAYQLGEELAKNDIGLVYGGAKVGLMNAVANGTIDRGGYVTGVLPHFLKDKELAHDNLNEIIFVETMHERKAKMYDLSDGIISLPGGFGTMDEMFEFLTWAQLSLHRKPTGILNINGYYNHLIEFMNTTINSGFVKEEHRSLFIISDNIEDLIQQMQAYTPTANEKWFVTK